MAYGSRFENLVGHREQAVDGVRARERMEAAAKGLDEVGRVAPLARERYGAPAKLLAFLDRERIRGHAGELREDADAQGPLVVGEERGGFLERLQGEGVGDESHGGGRPKHARSLPEYVGEPVVAGDVDGPLDGLLCIAHAPGEPQRSGVGEQELAVAPRFGVGPEALRLQRPLVELRGVLVGKAPHRRLGGLARVALDLRGLGARQGAVRVVGELVDAEVSPRAPFECAHDPRVELRPPGGGQLFVECRADRVVDEPVGARAPAWGDEARAGRVVETQKESFGVEPERPLQDGQVELLADHARDVERSTRFGRQAREPRAQYVPRDAGNGDVVGPERGRALAIAEGGEQPRGLLQEERIAAALRVNGRLDLGREVHARDLGDVRGDLLRIEPRKGDALAGAEPAEGFRPGVGVRKDGVAGGCDDEQFALRQLGAEEYEQIERGFVRPVHVVEEDDAGRGLGALEQEATELLEHPEASRHGAARRDVGMVIDVRAGDELVEQRLPFGCERRTERSFGKCVTNDLHPRPERGSPSPLEAAACPHPHVQAARHQGELVEATGLSDARFAGQQDQATAPRAGLVQRADQALHGVGAPDEGVGGHARPRGHREPWRRSGGRVARAGAPDRAREAVTASADGLDGVVRVCVLAKDLAGSAYGPGYRRVVHVLTRPEGVEELFLADDPVAVLDQVADRVEDLRLEGHFLVGSAELVRARVKLEIAEEIAH